MVAKFGQARREAFFAALRATGNQTLAAERAKVSRSWVQLHRGTDAEFRRAVDEAIAEAIAALHSTRDEPDCGRPPSGWAFLDGEELVVRGTGGSAFRQAQGDPSTGSGRAGGKRVQIARARLRQWTPRVEERFLEALAATCNVKAACAEVGLTAASAYNHRKRWPRFAERWDGAIDTGFARLEAGLLEHACNLFSGEGPPVLAPLPTMTAAEALQLLHMHKHGVRGIGKAPGKRWQRPKTLEEVKPRILRKLEMFMASREVSEEQRAADEAEWAARRPAPPVEREPGEEDRAPAGSQRAARP